MPRTGNSVPALGQHAVDDLVHRPVPAEGQDAVHPFGACLQTEFAGVAAVCGGDDFQVELVSQRADQDIACHVGGWVVALGLTTSRPRTAHRSDRWIRLVEQGLTPARQAAVVAAIEAVAIGDSRSR